MLTGGREREAYCIAAGKWTVPERHDCQLPPLHLMYALYTVYWEILCSKIFANQEFYKYIFFNCPLLLSNLEFYFRNFQKFCTFCLRIIMMIQATKSTA